MDWIAVCSLMVGVVGIIPAVKALGPNQWKRSQEEFRHNRTFIKNNRKFLVNAAFQYYGQAPILQNIPFLTKKEWIPQSPVPVQKVRLIHDKEQQSPTLFQDLIARSRVLLPFADHGKRFPNFVEAIAALDKPKLLTNRKCYRLVKIDPDDPVLTFSISEYFDHLNSGEILTYETSKVKLDKLKRNPFRKQRMKLRDFIHDPFHFASRIVNPGVITLTIKQGKDGCSFFMLERSSKNVASGMNSYHVVPAGEFQPSSKSPVSEREDFDIWKNMMREYNEEFLGAEDVYGDKGSVTDYEEQPYATMNQALQKGQIRVFYLGFGLDPLNLKGDILTVCIIEEEIFDQVFHKMQGENEEGRLLFHQSKGVIQGIPFTEEYIDSFLTERDTVPTAMACLYLSWQHREALGLV